jgi:HSP20 family protein
MAQVPARRTGQGGSLATQRGNQPFDTFRRQFDSLFDRMWGAMLAPFTHEAGSMRIWDFGVTHNDNEIVVRAEMPGFEENEINVQLNGDVLTISAEKQDQGNGHEEYRSFFRSITVPSGIDPEQIQASYRNGVLELHIPRPQGSRPKRIQIQGQQAGTGQQSITSQPAEAGGTSEQGSDPSSKAASQRGKKQ